MERPVARMETREAEHGITHGLRRTISTAFLTAHLLTASAEQAEGAVMEAIDSRDTGDEEGPFVQVLSAAIQKTIRTPVSNDAESSEFFLPAELNAVLRLSRQLRQSYVLRVLVGFSRQVSAQLLQLSSRQVDEYTCEALKLLPSLADQSVP